MSDFLSVADQLHVLLSTRTHPDGRTYTLQEVSEGTGVGAATISQMRTGRIKNPQLSTLRALCQFFDIPLRYFETCTVEECYAFLQSPQAADEQPAEISEIALRATHLSREAQQDILTIIKWVQAAEQNLSQNEGMPPLPRLSRPNDTEST
jgi:transcriptional regulator with XRE-family HTH domain